MDAHSLLERPVVCVPRVPECLQAQYKAAKLVLLEALDAAPTHAEQLRAWKALLLIDRLLLWKGFRRGGAGRGGKRQNANQRAVAERLALFWSGQWGALDAALRGVIRPARRARQGLSPERIRELVEDGAWRKLLAGLRGGAPLVDSQDAEGDLRNLLLSERSWESRPYVAAIFDISEEEFQAAVARELRESSPHAAAGRDGGRSTHWQAGSGDDRYESLLARALKRWLDGSAPPELDEIFSCQTLYALRKPNGGIRPIAVGAFLRRLALRALLRRKRQEVRDAVGEMQFALGRAGGADAAFKAIYLNVESGVNRGVLSVDLKNAYGSIRRTAVQDAVRKRAPWLGPLVDRLLGTHTRNAFDTADGDAIWIEHGTCVPQGCPLSTFLLCVTVAGVLENA